MPIDYKTYPPNWKSEIVPRILKRANYKCEQCGRMHGQQVRSYKVSYIRKRKRVYRQDWDFMDPLNEGGKLVTVILTVAHLDHDHWNFSVKDERLRALCQLCHLRNDAQHKADKREKLPEFRDPLQLDIFAGNG